MCEMHGRRPAAGQRREKRGENGDTEGEVLNYRIRINAGALGNCGN